MGDVIERLTKGLRLDIARDKTPDEAASKVIPTFQSNRPAPVIRHIVDISANSNYKALEVPEGKTWRILYGCLGISTSATVGNRNWVLQILDNVDGQFYRIVAANTQAASSTEYFELGQFGDVSETVAGNHLFPIPVNLWLTAGMKIVIIDSADISSNDNILFKIVIEEYDYVMT